MSKVRVQDLIHFVPEDLKISHVAPVASGTTLCGLAVVRHEDVMAAARAPVVLGEKSGPMVPARLARDDTPVTCIGCIGQGR